VKTTVFLGGGRITGALLGGLRLAGYKEPVVVHDRHPRKLRQLQREYGVIPEARLRSAVDQAHLLIVAVRPESVADLLTEIGELRRPVISVSVAAGVPLTNLRARLGSPVGWARAMPSPVCRSGQGLTALTFERALPQAARQEIRNFFGKVGPVLEIPESKFDAFTVTYSCSHGYHALAALAGAAKRLGLDRKSALTAAAHALADGIISWREGNLPLNRLLHEAATPGGIAATVMAAMDRSGYPRIIERGLRAGKARAAENAKRSD